MAAKKKVKKMIWVLILKEDGTLMVREVSSLDDGTIPYKDITSSMTTGDKNAQKNLMLKRVQVLEA